VCVCACVYVCARAGVRESERVHAEVCGREHACADVTACACACAHASASVVCTQSDSHVCPSPSPGVPLVRHHDAWLVGIVFQQVVRKEGDCFKALRAGLLARQCGERLAQGRLELLWGTADEGSGGQGECIMHIVWAGVAAGRRRQGGARVARQGHILRCACWPTWMQVLPFFAHTQPASSAPPKNLAAGQGCMRGKAGMQGMHRAWQQPRDALRVQQQGRATSRLGFRRCAPFTIWGSHCGSLPVLTCVM